MAVVMPMPPKCQVCVLHYTVCARCESGPWGGGVSEQGANLTLGEIACEGARWKLARGTRFLRGAHGAFLGTHVGSDYGHDERRTEGA